MKVVVDSLEYSFPDGFEVRKYDEMKHYKQISSSPAFQFLCECVQCPSHNCTKKQCQDYSSCNQRKKSEGLKGVDLIAKNSTAVFLIESKDYRQNPTPPVDHIVNEVAKKFRDTLFGIWSGTLLGQNDDEEHFLNGVLNAASQVNFIFHFESPIAPYASGFIRNNKVVPLVNMQQSLEIKLGKLKNYLKVVDMDQPSQCPWTVTTKP